MGHQCLKVPPVILGERPLAHRALNYKPQMSLIHVVTNLAQAQVGITLSFRPR
jgi:hypothetical protein